MNSLMEFAGGMNDGLAWGGGAAIVLLILFVCWAMHYSD